MLADLAEWQALWLPLVPVSINIHRHEVHDSEHLSRLEALITRSGVARTLIALGVNEGRLLGQGASRAARVLASWASSGVGVSLDDFGTGVASVTQLKDLRIDELKIDHSFVRDLEQDVESRAIVKAVIDLAQALSITVVAAGIETPEQARLLRAMGCPVGQGYLFSKPVPPSRAREMLAATARGGLDEPPPHAGGGRPSAASSAQGHFAKPSMPALARQSPADAIGRR